MAAFCAETFDLKARTDILLHATLADRRDTPPLEWSDHAA
jgi:hypothetical protein